MENNKLKEEKKFKKIEKRGEDKGSDGSLIGDRTEIIEVAEQEVFTPKNRLIRSPPDDKWETPVGEGMESDNYEDEDIRSSPIFQLQGENEAKKSMQIIQAKKRRRKGTPTQKQGTLAFGYTSEDFDAITKMMGRVKKRSKELIKLVNESTKTKVEIKQVARELDYLVDELEKRVGVYEKKHVLIDKAIGKEDRETEVLAHSINISVGVQVDWEDVELERQRREESIRTEIRDAFQRDSGFSVVEKLLDEVWPEDTYVKTEVDTLSPGKMLVDEDYAVLLDLGNVQENKALEMLMKTHPSLKEMVGKNNGQPDYVLEMVSTRTKNQEISEKTTAIYILPQKIDKKGVNVIEHTYNAVKELKSMMEIHPTKKLNIVLGEGLDVTYTRKVCEYIFAETEMKIIILALTSKLKSTSNKKEKPKTGKVVVKTG